MSKTRCSFMTLIALCLILASCGRQTNSSGNTDSDIKTKDNIVIGFSQLGAESDWRSANTESMKASLTLQNGYELVFDDGQQRQANQITAIRSFIQQEVDYIVLAPVTETGWDTVLSEVKDAKIPVIIVDRMVDVSDESLFTCWVGSDFELEAKKATGWLESFLAEQKISPEEVHIVNIQGTIGASAQIGRTKGLADAAAANGWDLKEEVSGEFTQTKGREVMEYFLNKYNDINVVYCENDNEAFGAIEAIESAGKTVGNRITEGEIMIISFDGVSEEALNKALEAKIACITECNPLHGPRVKAIIDTLEAGGIPDKFEYVDENIFSAYDAIDWIMVDETEYPVIKLTSQVIKQRLDSFQ